VTVTDIFECIHGLGQGTCSICSGRDAREAASRQTLSELLREACEKYPGKDRREIARGVIDYVLERPDAADLFLPAAMVLMEGIERAPTRRAEVEAVKSCERSQQRSGRLKPAKPSDATPRDVAIPPSEGKTLAESIHDQEASYLVADKERMLVFVMGAAMKKYVTIDKVKMRWEDVTRSQAQSRLASLGRLEDGVRDSKAFVRLYIRVLDVTGATTVGEYKKKMLAAEAKSLKPAKRA